MDELNKRLGKLVTHQLSDYGKPNGLVLMQAAAGAVAAFVAKEVIAYVYARKVTAPNPEVEEENDPDNPQPV